VFILALVAILVFDLALVLAFILAFVVWVFVLGPRPRPRCRSREEGGLVGDVAGVPLTIVVWSARKWGGGDGGLTWGSPSALASSLGVGNR
jgi:hypothetical protein